MFFLIIQRKLKIKYIKKSMRVCKYAYYSQIC